MIILLIIIAFFICLIFLTSFIIDKCAEYSAYKNYIKINSNRVNSSLPISFSHFHSLYEIAPQKWYTNFDTVNYFCNDQNQYIYTTFYFTPIKELKLYKEWYEQRENKIKQKQKNKELSEMIECWKKDIEKFNSRG